MSARRESDSRSGDCTLDEFRADRSPLYLDGLIGPRAIFLVTRRRRRGFREKEEVVVLKIKVLGWPGDDDGGEKTVSLSFCQ